VIWTFHIFDQQLPREKSTPPQVYSTSLYLDLSTHSL